MDPQNTHPWHKKKRYLIPVIGVVTLLSLSDGGNTPQNHPTQGISPAAYQTEVRANTTSQGLQPPAYSRDAIQKSIVPPVYDNSGLSNDNHYTNSAGNEVHSPAYSNTVPAGASAQCRDGTYSFSQSRRGTCSHHGGVSRWL